MFMACEDEVPKSPMTIDVPVPKDWTAVNLGKGYSIAFPKPPKKVTQKNNVTYTYEDNDAIFSCYVYTIEHERFKKEPQKYFYSYIQEIEKGFDKIKLNETPFETEDGEGVEIEFRGKYKTRAFARFIARRNTLFIAVNSFYIARNETLLGNKNIFLSSFRKD